MSQQRSSRSWSPWGVRDLPGCPNLLRSAWPLGRALLRSAWISARGLPVVAGDAGDVPQRLVISDPRRRADVGAYLELTDGQDLARSEVGPLPPLYFLTWSLAAYVDLLTCPELGFSLFGTLHVRNDLEIFRPTMPGETIRSRVYVERIQRDPTRALLSVRADCEVAGELLSRMQSLLYVGTGGAVESASNQPMTANPRDSQWETIRRVDLPANLGRRYGCLTGDLNPIHLSPWTSRIFGLKHPIAHGFCIKAVVAHALVRHVGGRLFDSLRRLRLRFRAPVPLPGKALCQVRGQSVRLVDPEEGTVFLTGRYRMETTTPRSLASTQVLTHPA